MFIKYQQGWMDIVMLYCCTETWYCCRYNSSTGWWKCWRFVDTTRHPSGMLSEDPMTSELSCMACVDWPRIREDLDLLLQVERRALLVTRSTSLGVYNYIQLL